MRKSIPRLAAIAVISCVLCAPQGFAAETSKAVRTLKDARPAVVATSGVSELTSQECLGLGGVDVQTPYTMKCKYSACATTDKHGVVRLACIDEKAPN